MGQYPSVNDRDYDLLKKIATNSAVIADSGGGGGGGSYSEAANFASLPPAGLFSGTTYLVRAAQGVYFVSRKPAGLYRSDGASWNYLADATEAYFQDTLAWNNITSKPATFPPSTHATSHSDGGSDPVTITNLAGFTGDTTKFLRADGTFQTAGGGSGDVVGPASSVDAQIAVFDGLTGKLLKDGGKTIATVLSDAASDATTKANAAQAAAEAASQPIDSDLTAIAGLTPSNDDIIQRKSGAWTNRTIAQLITDLSLTSSSVGLGNVTNDAQTKAAIVPNTAPAAGEILVGNAGGTAYAKQAMSGDATLSSAGALTIANSAVTLAKMANIDGTAAEVILGRSTASSGVPELIATTGTRGSAVVLATSPTLVTPVLGTPASGDLSNTTNYPVASTSRTGATPQATAPAAGLLSVLGIGNGETVRADKPLFDTTNPAALGSVSPGTQVIAARRDHVHAMPTAADVAALPIAGGTMTGSITLSENTGVALDPAGSADGKWTGITVTGVAGYTQAFGDLVTLDKDDSRWEAVDISVAAAATGDARGIIGIVVSAGTDGTACTVLLHGIIRADANFPALTIGAPVYASTTGDVVVTQPTTTDYVIRIVGFGLTADEMYFNPDNSYITHT